MTATFNQPLNYERYWASLFGECTETDVAQEALAEGVSPRAYVEQADETAAGAGVGFRSSESLLQRAIDEVVDAYTLGTLD